MDELGAISDLAGARRQLRAPALRRRHRGPGQRRARREGQERATRDRDAAPLLRARVGRDRRRGRRGAPRGRRPRLLPPPPAHRPPLPPAPAHRARGEDPHREVASPGASAWSRLFSELTSAIRGRPARRRGAGRARRRALAACSHPDREVRRDRRRGASPRRSARACARARYIFNTLLADKATDDRLRGYPTLDRRAQPLQRGERRVGAGADRGRARPLRRRRAAGTGSRRRLLGLDRLADYDRDGARSPPTRRRVRWDEAPELVLDCLRGLLARAGRRSSRRFFDERWIDAPVAARQARRRVLRLHGAVASTRT